jgi:hypothetical protein
MALTDTDSKNETPKSKASSTKANKAARESEQRLKQAQRAANLLKQVSDPTRL